MIAPRAVIILGNDEYVWLGDESGYKSTMAALQVFTAMGVPNSIGYDFTSNHPHCGPPATQMNSVNAFVNRFLKGGTTPPNIAIKPPDTSFDLNWQADITWTNALSRDYAKLLSFLTKLFSKIRNLQRLMPVSPMLIACLATTE